MTEKGRILKWILSRWIKLSIKLHLSKFYVTNYRLIILFLEYDPFNAPVAKFQWGALTPVNRKSNTLVRKQMLLMNRRYVFTSHPMELTFPPCPIVDLSTPATLVRAECLVLSLMPMDSYVTARPWLRTRPETAMEGALLDNSVVSICVWQPQYLRAIISHLRGRVPLNEWYSWRFSIDTGLETIPLVNCVTRSTRCCDVIFPSLGRRCRS